MAALCKSKKSPFWYLRFKDSNGKWKSRTTQYRHAVTADTRKARQLEAETTAKERRGMASRDSAAWKTWVPAWIAGRFTDPLTRKRVNECWASVSAFLGEREIKHPAMVTRNHCFEFHEWRKKSAHHNTALFELKYFAQIMGEARNRGFIHENPAQRLGIGKVAAKEKTALTDEQIATLQADFEKTEWMARAFKIALCHGVRLKETQVPMSDVHLAENVIVFNKTKGKKPFGAPIHPALREDLERWKVAGDAFTCVLPRDASRVFHRAFKRLGVPASFHSTRVTVATRMAIGGIDERIAKLYLNHGSSLVHSIYVKLRPEHAAGVSAALVFPGHANAPASEKSP